MANAREKKSLSIEAVDVSFSPIFPLKWLPFRRKTL